VRPLTLPPKQNPAHRLNTDDVPATLMELFVEHRQPAFIRWNSGREFTVVRCALAEGLQVNPGISNPAVLGKMAQMNHPTPICLTNLLGRELFYSLAEARLLIECWRAL
jgi:putative transposase